MSKRSSGAKTGVHKTSPSWNINTRRSSRHIRSHNDEYSHNALVRLIMGGLDANGYATTVNPAASELLSDDRVSGVAVDVAAAHEDDIYIGAYEPAIEPANEPANAPAETLGGFSCPDNCVDEIGAMYVSMFGAAEIVDDDKGAPYLTDVVNESDNDNDTESDSDNDVYIGAVDTDIADTGDNDIYIGAADTGAADTEYEDANVGDPDQQRRDDFINAGLLSAMTVQ